MCPIRARQPLFTNAAASEPPLARFRIFSTKLFLPKPLHRSVSSEGSNLLRVYPINPQCGFYSEYDCTNIHLTVFANHRPELLWSYVCATLLMRGSNIITIIQTYTSQCSPTIGQSCFGRMCVQHCSCAEAILLLLYRHTPHSVRQP